jgi:poly(3-hydroxybutyrate) depolymerase
MLSPVITLGLVGFAASGVAGAAFNAYNVDPASVSVSGLSAGGFMATQLGVTCSDTFKTGFGLFAGGPFDCARNQYVR